MFEYIVSRLFSDFKVCWELNIVISIKISQKVVNLLLNAYRPKMIRHTFKIVQQMPQDLESVSDHSRTIHA